MSEINSAKNEFSIGYLRYVIIFLFFVNTINLIDRMLLAVVLEPIKLEYDLTDTQLGWLTGIAFALFYASAGLVLAQLADRRTRTKLLAVVIAIWSGFTALTGMAQSYAHLFITRIGVGIGEAGCIPTGHSLIADYFPKEKRAFPMAIFMAGIPLGTIIGFVLGGMVAEHFGWRLAFILIGAPGLLCALLALLTIREPVRGGFDNKKLNKVGIPLSQQLKSLLNTPTYCFVTLAAIVELFVTMGLTQWGPTFFIRVHDLNIAEVGKSFGLAFGGGTLIGTLFGGKLSDILSRRDERWRAWIPGLATVLSIPFLTGVFYVDNTQQALQLLFFGSLIASMNMGPAFAAQMSCVPARTRATASAIGLLLSSIFGTALVTVIVGMASDALTPEYGVNALKYALIGVPSVRILASILFFLASKYIRQDQARVSG